MFTLLQISIHLLSFDTSYKMYWPCTHGRAQIISNGDVRIDLHRINGIKRVCHGSEQRDADHAVKKHSLAFLLSLLWGFFWLDSLFWHRLPSLNLVTTQHYYSAQIDFDMHEFKLFLFSHALKHHHVAWHWRYILLIKRVSFLLGHTQGGASPGKGAPDTFFPTEKICGKIITIMATVRDWPDNPGHIPCWSYWFITSIGKNLFIWELRHNLHIFSNSHIY